MKKFIIDIPDSTIWIDVPQSSMKNGLITFTTKSIPVEKLTPYTEPDRKAIEDEVWEFAGKMIATSENEVSEMWGCATNFGEVMHNTTYSEAKAKYEEWLKQKDDIYVGDEVENASHKKGIVLNHHISLSNGLEYVRVLYMDDDGNSFVSAWEKNNVGKTGRHFDEVGQMLEKMRGVE